MRRRRCPRYRLAVSQIAPARQPRSGSRPRTRQAKPTSDPCATSFGLIEADISPARAAARCGARHVRQRRRSGERDRQGEREEIKTDTQGKLTYFRKASDIWHEHAIAGGAVNDDAFASIKPCVIRLESRERFEAKRQKPECLTQRRTAQPQASANCADNLLHVGRGMRR